VPVIEGFNGALIACVKACGGSKVVACKLWPEKSPLSAQRLLLDCLSDDRPQKLSPEQVLLVMRMARDAACHEGMEFIAAELGYSWTPIEPEDERATLQRAFVESTKQLLKMGERIELLQAPAKGRAR
jgi:hypothetical protein